MKTWSLALACLLAAPAAAQLPPPPAAPVVVSGTVPDERARAAVLASVRAVFGAERISDQLAIGKVAAPADWHGYVQKMIGPHLKSVSAGQLKIEGNAVSVRGDVASEAQRQSIAAALAAPLNPTYTVSNGLRVRELVIPIPRDRTVEFESGRAVLTPAGRAILDEVVSLMQQRQYGNINVIGHTDNQGLRARNLALSLARAQAVKDYVVGKGFAAAAITASGEGPDRPVADNRSALGRASNRRIEFRVVR